MPGTPFALGGRSAWIVPLLCRHERSDVAAPAIASNIA